jgi:hypothetical protein
VLNSHRNGDGETGVYIREGTTSRVMAADRSYGEFYDIYSVSPEYFGYTPVNMSLLLNLQTYAGAHPASD